MDRDTMPENLIFALDIGTRSVTGVVGVPKEDTLEVLFVETVEHTHRAVVDGQIENIDQTAKVVGTVKKKLENLVGSPLSHVHVAAAGRVLKTREVFYEMETDENRAIEAAQIYKLESGAIQKSYEALMEQMKSEEDSLSFYCVGHSVSTYLLDGYEFSTLLGHHGKKIGVQLIATFLPSEVVESLYQTMRQCGLSIASMTLEPIAAINAIIPKELRLLNVALVDVGAGTSDIAVSRDGRICAYTMGTVAGDEVTEQMMKELLCDFETAEKAKMLLSDGVKEISYTDILGYENTVLGAELEQRMQPVIDLLAQTIGEKIIDANGTAPMAVFLVGGGSHTPKLTGALSAALNMDERKIAVGGNTYMKKLIDAPEQYIAAEYATPMGIALSAVLQGGHADFAVTLNGELMRIGSSGSSALEVLLRGGYEYAQIMGRSGKSLTFLLNGEKRVIRGELPTLASVTINGKIAGITTPLQSGDIIEFIPAVSGSDADMTVENAVPGYRSFPVLLGGEEYTCGTVATVNGVVLSGGDTIGQMDEVTTTEIKTLGEFIDYYGLSVSLEQTLIDGRPAESEDTALSAGAEITLTDEEALRHLTEEEEKENSTASQEAQPIQIVLNGEQMTLEPKPDISEYYFFDVLSYLEIDPGDAGGEIVLQRNGRDASYVEMIHEGDEINVFWNE